MKQELLRLDNEERNVFKFLSHFRMVFTEYQWTSGETKATLLGLIHPGIKERLKTGGNIEQIVNEIYGLKYRSDHERRFDQQLETIKQVKFQTIGKYSFNLDGTIKRLAICAKNNKSQKTATKEK